MVSDVGGASRTSGGRAARCAPARPASVTAGRPDRTAPDTTDHTHPRRRPHRPRHHTGALDGFLAALNSHDVRAWAETLHYPHVRVHEGAVTVWDDAEEYTTRSGPELADLLAAGWVRSAWDSVEPNQASAGQVHAAVRFTRYDAAGRPAGTFDSVYVLTRRESRWGVIARTGFQVDRPS